MNATKKEKLNESPKNRKTRGKIPFDIQLSIIKLLAAENTYKLLAVFVGMVILETGVFSVLGLRVDQGFIEASVYAAKIPLYIILAVSFVLVCIILSNTLTSKGGKPVYTIQRLLVDEERFFVLNSIYNALVFITYLGFQVLAVLLMIGIYNLGGYGDGGPQNIMMGIYRSPFFTSIAPIENWYMAVRNILFCFCLGVLTALQSQRSREGQKAYGLFFSAAAIALTFIYSPLEISALSLRIRDIVAMLFTVPAVFIGFASGKAHRAETWESDEFEAKVSEYENKDEDEA